MKVERDDSLDRDKESGGKQSSEKSSKAKRKHKVRKSWSWSCSCCWQRRRAVHLLFSLRCRGNEPAPPREPFWNLCSSPVPSERRGLVQAGKQEVQTGGQVHVPPQEQQQRVRFCLPVCPPVGPSACLSEQFSSPSCRSKRSSEKKEEPVPSPSLAGLPRPPKAELADRKRTFSQSSTSLSSGTGSSKEGSHGTKGSSASKHRKGEDKGRSTRDGKVGVREERQEE